MKTKAARTARHMMAIIAAVCVMFTYSFTAADEVHAATETQKQAELIEIGSEASGTLDDGSSDHYYKFTTDGSGGTYVVNASCDSGSTELYLYNDSFEPAGGCTITAGCQAQGVAFAGLKANTEYFLEVSSNDSDINYLIDVYNVEDVLTTCDDDDVEYLWVWAGDEEDEEWEEDEDVEWEEDEDVEWEDDDEDDGEDVEWEDDDEDVVWEDDDEDVEWEDDDDTVVWEDDDEDVELDPWVDDGDNEEIELVPDDDTDWIDNSDDDNVWVDDDDRWIDGDDESGEPEDDAEDSRETSSDEDGRRRITFIYPFDEYPEEDADEETVEVEEEEDAAPEAEVSEPEPEKKESGSSTNNNKNTKKTKKNTKKSTKKNSSSSKKNTKKNGKNNISSPKNGGNGETIIYNYYPSGSDSSEDSTDSWSSDTETADEDTEDVSTADKNETPEKKEPEKKEIDNTKKYFEGSIYELNPNGTAKLMRAANKDEVTVPATIMDKKGKLYTVTGIDRGAFKNSKATTIIVKTRDLTSEGVTGCLEGSNVSTVKVRARIIILNLKYKWSYKKFFKEENSGKAIKIK